MECWEWGRHPESALQMWAGAMNKWDKSLDSVTSSGPARVTIERILDRQVPGTQDSISMLVKP